MSSRTTVDLPAAKSPDEAAAEDVAVLGCEPSEPEAGELGPVVAEPALVDFVTAVLATDPESVHAAVNATAAAIASNAVTARPPRTVPTGDPSPLILQAPTIPAAPPEHQTPFRLDGPLRSAEGLI